MLSSSEFAPTSVLRGVRPRPADTFYERLVDRMFSATVVFCAFLAFLRAQFDPVDPVTTATTGAYLSLYDDSVCAGGGHHFVDMREKPRVVELGALHTRDQDEIVTRPNRLLLELDDISDDTPEGEEGESTSTITTMEIPPPTEPPLDSDEYAKKGESMYSDDPPCEPMHSWQMQTNPVCNILHEKDMTDFFVFRQQDPEQQPDKDRNVNSTDTDIETSIDIDTRTLLQEKVRYLAAGGYREVYMIRDDGDRSRTDNRLALKTLKFSRPFTERHTDRHRRDAVAADRLSSTPESVDIYAFCGNSALYQFAKGGNLRDAIARYIPGPPPTEEDEDDAHGSSWSSGIRIHIAYQVASGIAAVHNVDEEGRASLAHTDISTDQFVSMEGEIVFKINDFNRARFLRQSSLDNTKTCPFTVKSNKGRFRSPEEYRYDPETEAIDVYSMGNIFYVLLTGQYPFSQFSKKAVKKAVANGLRPDFGALADSPDPNVQAMIAAARMCWVHDPAERATARQVQLFLQSKLPEATSPED